MAKPKPKGDGPALDFELPQITEEDWSEFEGIIDSPLNNEERLEITEAAEHCVVGRFFADEDRKRIAMRGRLHDGKVKRSTSALAFLKAMDRLVETWRKVQIDPDARKAIEDYSDEPAFDLLHAMEDLQFHRVALRLFLMRVPRKPLTPRGHISKIIFVTLSEGLGQGFVRKLRRPNVGDVEFGLVRWGEIFPFLIRRHRAPHGF